MSIIKKMGKQVKKKMISIETGNAVVERRTGIDEFSRESRRLKRASTASLKKRCIVVRCKNELVYPFASTLRAQDRVI